MSKVTELRGLVSKTEPVPQVVAILERYLEMAKSGELRAVGIAGLDVFGAAETGAERGAEGTFALLGAISYLKHRICIALDNN